MNKFHIFFVLSIAFSGIEFECFTFHSVPIYDSLHQHIVEE